MRYGAGRIKMKFRYYVTDLTDGSVKGTNSTKDADNLSYSEDFFVVDSETGEWLVADGERHDIEDISA
jgi:hypothetical protein